MKTINRTWTETLSDAWKETVRCGRFALRRLERMSWPSLVMACLLLALLITVLPLALTLFVLFVLVKLAVNLLGGGRPPRHHVHENHQ